MKQEQKTHVSADALIQLLKGAKAIRWQLALGVVMSLALVVCALIIPTQMGALVQILIDYFDAPETARPCWRSSRRASGAGRCVSPARRHQLRQNAAAQPAPSAGILPAILRTRSSDKIQRLPVSLSITRPSAIFSRA